MMQNALQKIKGNIQIFDKLQSNIGALLPTSLVTKSKTVTKH